MSEMTADPAGGEMWQATLSLMVCIRWYDNAKAVAPIRVRSRVKPLVEKTRNTTR